ncbi:Proteasome subunit beta type-7 [Acropora cervicornis]|uniref:Proteasome subunit beta type-7 n=1 Tax=Acropora cervicornis TaxID=6130 RepID=A0AAD9URV1_ACRCE|nr:Proteasome subunit beta type-7 [Acropora cervicornis]
MHCMNDSTKTFKMAAIGGTVAQEHCGGFSFENCKSYQARICTTLFKINIDICLFMMVLFLGVIQEQQRILLLLIRIVPRFTTLLQIFSKYTQKDLCCCGAGTAADKEYVTQLISSNIQLHFLLDVRYDLIARIVTALRMLKQRLFRYQGYISAALVLGGVNLNGPTLHTVYPHGSTDKLPYVTMGYGSLAAMSVFESRCKPDMELDEAKKLVRDAIAAGIFNDLGSGSNVDLCIITKEGTEYLRPYDVANDKGVRQGRYSYKRGTTG